MRRISSGFKWFVAILAICGAMIFGFEHQRARADEMGFKSGILLANTAGVVSSNGTNSVAIFSYPGGGTVTPTHRCWIGGLTIFNTDSSAHTVFLLSHVSRRVVWGSPIAGNGGVILDNVNMLFSDQGTTASPEGIDMILENGAAAQVGAVGGGYFK